MKWHIDEDAAEQLRRQIQRLILLRETGPKSARWHAARARLIWRLQDELRRVMSETGTEGFEETGPPQE